MAPEGCTGGVCELAGWLIAKSRAIGETFRVELLPVMIRKGESMLLHSGRVSLPAALLIFALAPLGSCVAQDDHSDFVCAQQHAAADHPETGSTPATDACGHDTRSHGGGHADPAGTPPLLQIDIGSAICNLAIFLGVLAILSKFVWPVILGGLQAREDKIHGDLEAAEKANAEAKSLLTEYQSKLDDAASQVQAMLAQARKDSEASGQRIVDARQAGSRSAT